MEPTIPPRFCGYCGPTVTISTQPYCGQCGAPHDLSSWQLAAGDGGRPRLVNHLHRWLRLLLAAVGRAVATRNHRLLLRYTGWAILTLFLAGLLTHLILGLLPFLVIALLGAAWQQGRSAPLPPWRAGHAGYPSHTPTPGHDREQAGVAPEQQTSAVGGQHPGGTGDASGGNPSL